jgi:hypothetical protein
VLLEGFTRGERVQEHVPGPINQRHSRSPPSASRSARTRSTWSVSIKAETSSCNRLFVQSTKNWQFRANSSMLLCARVCACALASVHSKSVPTTAENCARTWMHAQTKPIIPNLCNKKQPFGVSKCLYKHRRRIESAFNRLKDFRRIATRYDRLTRNYLASAALRPLLYGGFESGP